MDARRMDANPEASERWDIMLSYRHAKHKNAAGLLAGVLRAAGVRTWLDVAVLDQTCRWSSDQLKAALRSADEKSRIVVGFPAEDMLEVEPSKGDEQLRFCWLAWERQFAAEVLWISGDRLYAFPEESLRWFNLAHLSYYLGLACGKGRDLTSFWHKYLEPLSPVFRASYHIEPLHEMECDALPEIIRPDWPEARRNAVLKSHIARRRDIAPDHRMQILE